MLSFGVIAVSKVSFHAGKSVPIFVVQVQLKVSKILFINMPTSTQKTQV
jgi:hypothetical protein